MMKRGEKDFGLCEEEDRWRKMGRMKVFVFRQKIMSWSADDGE